MCQRLANAGFLLRVQPLLAIFEHLKISVQARDGALREDLLQIVDEALAGVRARDISA